MNVADAVKQALLTKMFCTDEEIDNDAFIKAHVVCDEEGYTTKEVPNALDLFSNAGDVLERLLAECEGVLQYQGGKWALYPAVGKGTTWNTQYKVVDGHIKKTVEIEAEVGTAVSFTVAGYKFHV